MRSRSAAIAEAIARHIGLKRLLGFGATLLAITGTSLGDQPGNANAPCLVPERGGSCVLDVGEIAQGAVVTLWAKITNVGPNEIRFVALSPGAKCDRCPMETVVKPSETGLVQLRSLNTTGFKGPISKVYAFACDPPAALRVTLYASRDGRMPDKP